MLNWIYLYVREDYFNNILKYIVDEFLGTVKYIWNVTYVSILLIFLFLFFDRLNKNYASDTVPGFVVFKDKQSAVEALKL